MKTNDKCNSDGNNYGNIIDVRNGSLSASTSDPDTTKKLQRCLAANIVFEDSLVEKNGAVGCWSVPVSEIVQATGIEKSSVTSIIRDAGDTLGLAATIVHGPDRRECFLDIAAVGMVRGAMFVAFATNIPKLLAKMSIGTMPAHDGTERDSMVRKMIDNLARLEISWRQRDDGILTTAAVERDPLHLPPTETIILSLEHEGTCVESVFGDKFKIEKLVGSSLATETGKLLYYWKTRLGEGWCYEIVWLTETLTNKIKNWKQDWFEFSLVRPELQENPLPRSFFPDAVTSKHLEFGLSYPPDSLDSVPVVSGIQLVRQPAFCSSQPAGRLDLQAPLARVEAPDGFEGIDDIVIALRYRGKGGKICLILPPLPISALWIIRQCIPEIRCDFISYVACGSRTALSAIMERLQRHWGILSKRKATLLAKVFAIKISSICSNGSLVLPDGASPLWISESIEALIGESKDMDETLLGELLTTRERSDLADSSRGKGIDDDINSLMAEPLFHVSSGKANLSYMQEFLRGWIVNLCDRVGLKMVKIIANGRRTAPGSMRGSDPLPAPGSKEFYRAASSAADQLVDAVGIPRERNWRSHRDLLWQVLMILWKFVGSLHVAAALRLHIATRFRLVVIMPINYVVPPVGARKSPRPDAPRTVFGSMNSAARYPSLLSLAKSNDYCIEIDMRVLIEEGMRALEAYGDDDRERPGWLLAKLDHLARASAVLMQRFGHVPRLEIQSLPEVLASSSGRRDFLLRAESALILRCVCSTSVGRAVFKAWRDSLAEVIESALADVGKDDFGFYPQALLRDPEGLAGAALDRLRDACSASGFRDSFIVHLDLAAVGTNMVFNKRGAR